MCDPIRAWEIDQALAVKPTILVQTDDVQDLQV